MSRINLDALHAIVEKMTPGTWAQDDCNVFSKELADARMRAICAKIQGKTFDPAHIKFDAFIASTEQRHGQQSDDDADGIVALRNAAPVLLEELRALREFYDATHALQALMRRVAGGEVFTGDVVNINTKMDAESRRLERAIADVLAIHGDTR